MKQTKNGIAIKKVEKMLGTDQTFLKVLVIVCLGAFLATSATIMDTWKHRDSIHIKLSAATHQEALAAKSI